MKIIFTDSSRLVKDQPPTQALVKNQLYTGLRERKLCREEW